MKLGRFLEDVSDAPDPQLERLFAAARDVAEPGAEHRQRVAAALRAALPDALSSSAPPSAVGEAVRNGSDATARASIPSPKGEGLRALLSVRVGGHWLLLGALLVGGAGFWLGHWVGARAEATVAPSLPWMPSEPSVSEAAAPRARSEPIDPGDEDAGGQTSSSPRAPTPAPDVREPSQRRARVALATPPKRVAPAQRNPSFREVLDRLRRAREHLERGQSTLSLLMLSELDRSAGELLWEERETTRILALCASGEESAARLAASALEARNPGSIYAMRVSESCVGSAGAPARVLEK